MDDELLRRVRRELHLQAAESQQDTVQMYLTFADRHLQLGDEVGAERWEQAAARERARPLPNAPAA